MIPKSISKKAKHSLQTIKLPSPEKQLSMVTIALRVIVWGIWLGFIALDAVLASHSVNEALFWLPWVAMGLLMAWTLDTWIVQDKALHVVLLAMPFFVLSDFVQG